MAKTKVQITVDSELLACVDDYCKKYYMTRSGFSAVAYASIINHQRLVDAISDMSISINKIADTGCVDDDTLDKIEDFQRLVSYVQPK